MKSNFFVFVLCLSICSCNNENDSSTSDGEPLTAEHAEQTQPSEADGAGEDPHLDKVKEIIAFQPGINLIQSVELHDEVVSVVYTDKFTGKNNISVDEYWTSGLRIEKIMADLPIQLMRQTDYVNQVKITIPYKGKTHFADVSKEGLVEFAGTPFNNLASNVNELFFDPYVRNKEGRAKYLKKFVSIK